MKLFLFCILFLYFTPLNAQNFSYVFEYQTGTYNEFLDGTLSTASGDDGAENINLPFPFAYQGITYNTARISVNGWMELGQSYIGAGDVNDLSTPIAPLLCPLWDDLYADAQTQIRYKLINETPKIFIVQWKDVMWGDNGSRQNFQLRIYEMYTAHPIRFIYGQMNMPINGSASIGLINQTGGPENFTSVYPSGSAYYSHATPLNVINSNQYLFSGLNYNFYETLQGFGNYLTITQNSNTTPGCTNQVIMKFEFYTEALTPPAVQEIIFNTLGTSNPGDILNAKVFYTNDTPVLTEPVQFGSTVFSPNGQFSFTGNIILNSGYTYFWLLYDIAPNALIGNSIDAECLLIKQSISPPGIPNPSAPPGSVQVLQGMSGVYTVGAGQNFISLTAALNALSLSAVRDSVIFEFNNYSGSSEIFPIVINAFSGCTHPNSVIIRPSLSSDTVVLSALVDSATIDLKGAAYVTIDGRPGGRVSGQKIKIINSSNTSPAIRLKNSALGNQIEHCIIQSNSFDIFSGTIYAAAGESGGSYNNTISGCLIKNYSTAVFDLPVNSIYTAGNETYHVDGFNIIDCEIKNFQSTGINLNRKTRNITISGCTIYQDTIDILITGSPISGILIDSAWMNINITGNKIYNLYSSLLAPYDVKGIYVKGTYLPSAINIINNFLSLGNHPYCEATIYGIDCYGERGSTYYNIYNNTVSIGGFTYFPLDAFGIAKQNNAMGFNMINNIFIIKRFSYSSGAEYYDVIFPNINNVNTLDYNNYYGEGTSFILGFWNGTQISTLEPWKVITGKDQHSISKNVTFLSDIDLHIAGTSLGDFDLAGTHLSAVLIDIDNEIRPSQFPYMGADENLTYPLPVELVSFTASISRENIILEWTTSTEKNNSGFEVLRSSGNDWLSIGFISGSGTSLEPVSYRFIDKPGKSGLYSYLLKQVDFDGKTSYSDIVKVELSSPDNYSLSQNYPNPFNPQTKISYAIPVNCKVQLKLYDILGNIIKVLMDEEKESGYYEFVFDGSNLSSGTYIYEFKAGDFVQAKKMLILK